MNEYLESNNQLSARGKLVQNHLGNSIKKLKVRFFAPKLL